jgi:hypothetical protein
MTRRSPQATPDTSGRRGRGLTVQLVPSTCWFSNVRSAVYREESDLIRDQVYRQARARCGVCGGHGATHPVACHEIWHHDDERLMQTSSG